ARTNEPLGALLRHSLLSGRGLVLGLVLALAAPVGLFAALPIRGGRIGRRALSALDVAALGAALAVVIALARGSADASELVATRGTGLALLLIPAPLAAGAGGLA